MADDSRIMDALRLARSYMTPDPDKATIDVPSYAQERPPSEWPGQIGEAAKAAYRGVLSQAPDAYEAAGQAVGQARRGDYLGALETGVASLPMQGAIRAKKYPMAPKTEWYGDANYEQTGGKLTHMSPDEFLAKARPMELDEVALENIEDLKNHIASGGVLDPLALYPGGKEDGRHRAHAAKMLGIKSVPVLTWDEGRADGGRATNDWEDFLSTSGERLSDLGRTLGEAIYDPYKQLELARNVAEASGIAKGAGPLARAVAPLGHVDKALEAARQYAPDPHTVSRYGHAFTDYFAPPSYAEEPLRRGYDEGGEVEEQSYLPTRDSIANALRTARQVATHPVESAQEYYRSLPKEPLDIPYYAQSRPIAEWPVQAKEMMKALGNYVLKQAPRPLEQSPTELAAGFMPLTGAIKAYHGSPHQFERFDLSKIGTGEGAQAYGHGLYFAESEPVARAYREKLAGRPVGESGEDLFKDMSWLGNPQKELMSWQMKNAAGAGLSGDEALSHAAENLSKMGLGLKDSLKRQQYLDASNALYELRGKNWKQSPGHMYEVEIGAEPHEFLDWDKPLREHPEAIRRKLGWTPELERQHLAEQRKDDAALLAALEGSADYTPAKVAIPKGLPPLSATGEDIVRGGSVFDRASDAEKAARLRELGIPGLRYLDQGSRGAGEGSRNYVVFDDKLVNIKRRYEKGGEVEMSDNYNRLSALLRQVLGDEPVKTALRTARSKELAE